MQDYFSDRKKLCQIQGKPDEYIVFTRQARSNSRFAVNNAYKGLLQDNSSITNGDVITDDTNSYFAVGVRHSYLSSVAVLYKINCHIDIFRITPKFVNGTKVGDMEIQLHSNVPAIQDNVNANMKLYDAGILENTVKRILIPKLELSLLDRIKLDGKNYRVDAIDESEYEDMYYMQVSVDNRKTV